MQNCLPQSDYNTPYVRDPEYPLPLPMRSCCQLDHSQRDIMRTPSDFMSNNSQRNFNMSPYANNVFHTPNVLPYSMSYLPPLNASTHSFMGPSRPYPTQKLGVSYNQSYGSLNCVQQVTVPIKSHSVWEERRRKIYMGGFMDQPHVPFCGSGALCCSAVKNSCFAFHSGILFNR